MFFFCLGYPNHAECRVSYSIPQDCASIKSALAQQVIKKICATEIIVYFKFALTIFF
jgi:hypothetical protein